VRVIGEGQINLSTGKEVLGEMFASGKLAGEIVATRGLKQVSDQGRIAELVAETLRENPGEVESYRAGKTAVSNFLFGHVMKKAGGKANPQVVRSELEKQLSQ
jgi:aspartyl-tRNA(Asn)/glutamyl-tRNA(Gln) amidotransferase subunit B